MQKLLTAYSQYFNKKYERTGTLFSSRFKASHAESDEYLKYLFSYIHLNPVKLIKPDWKENGVDPEMCRKFINSYKFSSHPDYDGVVREERLILNREYFPDYFSTTEMYWSNLSDWINYEHLV
jgi:putative transposase